MILIDRMLISGVGFVLDKLLTFADQELNDAGRLREDLLAAQMQLELGEIGEDDFILVENRVMAALREIREHELSSAEALAGGDVEVSVDVDFGQA